MSMFTKVGNYAHGALLNGAGLSAMNQISSGAGIGAGLGAVNSMVTGQSSMIDGAISGAATGALLGAGTKYASVKYLAGVNSFINSTVDASGKVFAGTKASMVQDVSNFKFSHFSTGEIQNKHASWWHPDATMKTTRFQDYRPQYTPATNPTSFGSNWEQVDPYTKIYK